MELNINSEAVAAHTKRLERMHKSDLPIAIRGALNNAAFDVKQNTMPKEADKAFTNRRANFFKATSKVEQATGFNVKTMKAVVGFVGAEKNQAIRDLEQQEEGGNIKGRSFIPTKLARSGGSSNKLVRPINRTSNIKKIHDARKIKGKTQGQRFTIAAKRAGKGGLVLADYKTRTFLWRVNSLNKTKTNKWKLTALYSYEKGRSVKVESTKFMQKSSLRSAKNIEKYFIEQAEKRFAKL